MTDPQSGAFQSPARFKRSLHCQNGGRRATASQGQTPLVVEPSFAIAPGANTVMHITGGAAVRTFGPLIRAQRTANEARAFGSGRKRSRTFLVEKVECPDDGVTSRADSDWAVTPCRTQICGARHSSPRSLEGIEPAS